MSRGHVLLGERTLAETRTFYELLIVIECAPMLPFRRALLAGVVRTSIRYQSTPTSSPPLASAISDFNDPKARISVEGLQNAGDRVNNPQLVTTAADRLWSELRDKDLKTIDANAVFNKLKEDIDKLSENGEEGNRFFLRRSYSLNAPVASFLSFCSQSGQLDPYLVLDTLCQYQLARSTHFEIVLYDLLKRGSDRAQDVLALWIKYLETISGNSNAIVHDRNRRNVPSTSHTNNIALASVAYLLLPGNTPEIKTLYSLLQLDFEKDSIPFVKIRRYAETLFAKSDQTPVLSKLKDLYAQYLISKPELTINEIMAVHNFTFLNRDIYTFVKETAEENKENAKLQMVLPQILNAFMDQFITLQRPLDAIHVFNDFKHLESSLLTNKLMIAVAHLAGKSKTVALDRILAIWKSLVKNPDAHSFEALFKALAATDNYGAIENIWDHEIADKMKTNQFVLEAYLSGMSKDPKTNYKDIISKIPEKADIKSIDLINDILSKLIQKRDLNEFKAVYERYINEGDMSPNTESYALKMLYSYYSTVSDNRNMENFKFLDSIQDLKFNSLLVARVIEKFIELSPDITPVRKLHKELFTDAKNSRLLKYFVNAEFYKNGGSHQHAEDIFKTSIEKVSDKQQLKSILSLLINGFVELAITRRDPSYLLMVQTYIQTGQQLDHELSFGEIQKVLRALSFFARRKIQLGKDELKFANKFLEHCTEEFPNFDINETIMENLKEMPGLKLPKQ